MPDRVPPEIETLRANPHHAFHRAHDGEAVRSYVMIPLSDAEAAVRACEQRVLADVETACRKRDAERQRTVTEIVEALRGESDVSRSVGADLCAEDFEEAADLIEQRFGSEGRTDDHTT